MEGFSLRLKELRQRDRLTQRELAAKLGVSKSSVNMYERGDREPGFETMEAIADVFNVDMNSLYGKEAHPFGTLRKEEYRIGRAYGKASRREQDIVAHILEPYLEEDEPDNLILVDFNQSECRASAGKGIYLDEESMVTIKVRAEALPSNYLRSHVRYFGVPVGGNSMEPRFHDGDILIIREEPVNVGEVGVFTVEGEGYVKELGRGVLCSLNPEYEDIPLTEDVRCNGKVIGVLNPEDIFAE